MKGKISLSVVISAFNEGEKIKECLKSLSFADEIIFVDNNSTDKTSEIAQKYTSKIFIRPNNPMLNINKNYGFIKASGDWILSLDADERVTPELKEEIKIITNKQDFAQVFGSEAQAQRDDNGAVNGYWIPRKNIIFGKWIKHTGWYPDYQLRLFKKGKGRFPEAHVHEMIDVVGETGRLKNNIIHYNYETIFQFMQKLIYIYASNEANQLLKNGYKFSWQDAIRFPFKEFLSRFFAREGYKDGFHGLMLSILMAFYHFAIFSLIWERLKFIQTGDERLLQETEREFKKSYKELLFWSSLEKIKTIKKPIKRLAYRILRKFQ